MFDCAKKAIFVGLGLSSRVKELVDELVVKGEENESPEALKVKAFLESSENRCDKRKGDIEQKLSELCDRVVSKVSVPTKDDFNRLEKELHTLSGQFRQWKTRDESHAAPGASDSTTPS